MSKLEFLRSVRAARGFFFGPKVTTDHPGLDPVDVEAQLGAAAIWLTPAAVKGFKVDDFRELPDERRRELNGAVEEFVRVANQVPGNKPATADQVRGGMAALLKILGLLDHYLPDSAETRKFRAALKHVSLPDFVVNWSFEFGEDSDGDPAVWIYAFVKDDAVTRPDFVRETAKIRERVRMVLADAGIARVPSVRFRAASEQRLLENLWA